MEINDFVKKMAEQFEEIDTSKFTPKTVFKENDEYSSLIGLSIIAMIDDEYSVSVKGEEIRKAQTIEDLFNVVKAKK